MDSKTNNNLATVPENDPLEDGYTKVTISDLNLMVSAVDVESIKHLAVPTPKNEISRLKILRETNLLNSNYSQETFDLIANIAKRHFKVTSLMLAFKNIHFLILHLFLVSIFIYYLN